MIPEIKISSRIHINGLDIDIILLINEFEMSYYVTIGTSYPNNIKRFKRLIETIQIVRPFDQ